MGTATSTLDRPREDQGGVNNPALNPQAFDRGIEQAGAAERQGMTVAGTYLKTGLLLVILIAAAAFGWSQVEIATVNGHEVALQPAWTWLAFLLTFILGIAGAVAFRASPILGPLYALCEGALLGVAAHYFDLAYDGIVLQAVAATLCIFVTMLLLYSTGIVKVTSRLMLGVFASMGALALLYATAWLFSLVGVTFQFLYAPTPLGIALSLAVVVLGALNLPLDFEFIQRAVAAGAPKYMEWYAAYGLLLSLIWIYVSVLRLLALVRRAQG
jgi:uncharacterized YccA/Bax inhibitor family protein